MENKESTVFTRSTVGFKAINCYSVKKQSKYFNVTCTCNLTLKIFSMYLYKDFHLMDKNGDDNLALLEINCNSNGRIQSVM